MATVPDVTLNNGVRIPQLGFGVFQIRPRDTEDAVSRALEVGYRHFDTAEMYGNEAEVGAALGQSGLDPAEVFVTSKLNNTYHAFDAALAAFDETYAALDRPQVDLFLIHWPIPTTDYVETWRAMERILESGRVRSIGVSNFEPEHLDRLRAECDVVPAVNQIELHPYLTQEVLRAYHAEHGIATEAWSPIAQGLVLGDPVIGEVAKAHGRTPAQVVLRWHLQLGHIVFPKTLGTERMRENFNLFDFALERDDMERLSGLNQNRRTGPSPATFGT